MSTNTTTTTTTTDSDDIEECAVVNETTLKKDTNPILFHETKYIESVHKNAFRYGHTSDIDYLLAGTKQQGKNYVIGLLGTSLTVFGFFVVWILILLIFKILGYKRVGFFSGGKQMMIRPKPKRHDHHASEEDNEGQQQSQQSELACISPAVREYEEVPTTQQQQSLLLGKDDEQDNNNNVGVVVVPITDDEQTPTTADNQFDQTIAEVNTDSVVDYDDDNTPTCTTTIQKKSRNSNHDEDDDDDVDYYQRELREWKNQVAYRERRLRRIRITVLLCGLGIIVCVILMIAKGADGLVRASDDAIQGLEKAAALAEEGIALIDTYFMKQNEMSTSVRVFSINATQFCPNVRAEICLNVTDDTTTNCNYTDIPFSEELKGILNSTGSYIYNDLSNTRNELEQMTTTFQDLEQKARSFYWAFYVAATFGAALALFSACIVSGMIAAWRGKSKSNWWRRLFSFFRHWLFVPIFIFLVIMTWIFSMVFIIGSISSADMCNNSPDQDCLILLENNQDRVSGLVFDFSVYYILGCPGDGPLALRSQAEKVYDFAKDVYILADQIANMSDEEFFEKCGTEKSSLQVAAFTVGRILCLLGESLIGLQNYFSCENWRPLYTTVMYSAVCYAGNEAFYWISITQFVIVMLSMIMLTLRVAFFEIDHPEDFERAESFNGACDSNDQVDKPEDSERAENLTMSQDPNGQMSTSEVFA